MDKEAKRVQLKNEFTEYLTYCVSSQGTKDNLEPASIKNIVKHLDPDFVFDVVPSLRNGIESFYDYQDPNDMLEVLMKLKNNMGFMNNDNRRFRVTALSHYINFLRVLAHFSPDHGSRKEKTLDLAIHTGEILQPLQQIFFGAPGTGKSYSTNMVAKKYSTIRTTFHPDSDYSTFVGAYKPTTRAGKIEYRFVKQAFLKSYINAWKMFAEAEHTSFTQHSAVEIKNSDGTDKWILDTVDDSCIFYTKESRLEVKRFEDAVKRFWKNLTESDDPDNYGPGTNEMYEGAACIWFRRNNSIEYSIDECWQAIRNELKNGKEIDSNPGGNQTYYISLEDDTVIIRTKAKAWRESVHDHFEKNEEPSRSSIQIRIAKKLKEYNYGFDEAWNKLKEEVQSNHSDGCEVIDLNSIPPQFLVIEEINRGNCAQIFGDLFQLLDRKNGFSEYPIDADEDIRKCLLSEDTGDDPSFGVNGLSFSSSQKMVINEVFNSPDAPFHDVADDIARGKVLVLPCNLYIWATMNTSDQSLFPIDSAFKRRWEWKYTPIREGRDINGNPLNWRVEANTQAYSWWSFLQIINDKIYENTQSEDKKLGYFFCKSSNGVINPDTFVSKVLFYLWNDVFKGFDNGILFDESYDKFYDVNSNGKAFVVKSKVESLLDKLGVEVVGDVDNEDGEDEQDARMLFSLNNTGRFGKARVAFEALQLYVNNNVSATAEEIVAAWNALGMTNLIETAEAHAERESRSNDTRLSGKWNALRLSNNETVYLTNQYRGDRIDQFVKAINAQPWNIKIEKLEK